MCLLRTSGREAWPRRRQGTLWRIRATLGNVRGGTASAVGPKRSEAIRHGCACEAEGMARQWRWRERGQQLLRRGVAAAGDGTFAGALPPNDPRGSRPIDSATLHPGLRRRAEARESAIKSKRGRLQAMPSRTHGRPWPCEWVARSAGMERSGRFRRA